MAYKKYIKRGGKTFGPYYYESYRDKDGKVKKKYVGTTDPNKKKNKEHNLGKSKTLIFLGLIFILAVIVFSVQTTDLRDINNEIIDSGNNLIKGLLGYSIQASGEKIEESFEGGEVELDIVTAPLIAENKIITNNKASLPQ